MLAILLFISNLVQIYPAVIEVNCDAIGNYITGRQYCMVRHLRGNENTTFKYTPSIFATMKTELLFDNCTVSSIPKGIFYAFPNLRTMYTWNSGIETVSKQDFRNAFPLRIIDLSQNRISYLLDSTFFWAIDLEVISLSQNQINKIEKNAFHGLTNLKILHLQNNLIEELAVGTFDLLPQLTSLYLNNNSVSSIGKHLFRNNLELTSILLYDNQIKSIAGTAFQNLRKLDHFDIQNNPTEGLDLLIVDSVYTNLRNISCMGCYIGNRTEKLLASNNNISYVIDNSTGTIVDLDLSHNNLMSVKNLTKFNNLTDLDLSHNRIRDIDIKSFSNMTQLESLKLKKSGLSRVIFGLFSHKPKLKILDISFNGLGTLNLNMFAAITNLRFFYLEGNNFTDIDLTEIKQYFPHLTRIGISKNNWKCDALATNVKILESSSIQLNDVGLATQTSNVKGIPCTSDDETSSQRVVSMETEQTSNGDEKCHVTLTSPGDMDIIVKLIELKYEFFRISKRLDAVLDNLKVNV